MPSDAWSELLQPVAEDKIARAGLEPSELGPVLERLRPAAATKFKAEKRDLDQEDKKRLAEKNLDALLSEARRLASARGDNQIEAQDIDAALKIKCPMWPWC